MGARIMDGVFERKYDYNKLLLFNMKSIIWICFLSGIFLTMASRNITEIPWLGGIVMCNVAPGKLCYVEVWVTAEVFSKRHISIREISICEVMGMWGLHIPPLAWESCICHVDGTSVIYTCHVS